MSGGPAARLGGVLRCGKGTHNPPGLRMLPEHFGKALLGFQQNGSTFQRPDVDSVESHLPFENITKLSYLNASTTVLSGNFGATKLKAFLKSSNDKNPLPCLERGKNQPKMYSERKLNMCSTILGKSTPR